ncbi:MAG: hypothetical protein JXQ27_13025 [Acidobacteria bacterium]|nr:hypothetical protein [Acidobacteriota bacterium]
MCEMLANKYLVDGEFEKAIMIYEKILAHEPVSKSLLYSLLVAYALTGRCEESIEATHKIGHYFEIIEKEVLRQYRNRLTGEALQKLETCRQTVCRRTETENTVLVRLILAELAGDSDEVNRCLTQLKSINPDIHII